MKLHTTLSAGAMAGAMIVLCPVTLAQTDALAVDPKGDVGVGTATPSQAFHVFRDSGPSLALIQTDGDANQGEQAGFQFVNGAFGTPGVHTWDVRPGGVGNLIFNYNSGGVEFTYTTGGNLNLVGTVNEGSSRSRKQEIEPVDQDVVLAKVVDLHIAEWSYIHDSEQARHLGPMAEDFSAAFGLGSSEEHISSLDTNGVALASIQALKAQQDELRRENAELRAELAELRELVESMAGPERLASAGTSK